MAASDSNVLKLAPEAGTPAYRIDGIDDVATPLLRERFKQLSTLAANDGEPANAAQLDRRAREDSALLVGLLRAQGYYDERVTSRLEPHLGYVAPPLDGIWATAPYLHNGSVPTIATLLDSSKRPRYWSRSFESTDYDAAALGWDFAELDHGQAGEPTERARVKIYDTTLQGYGNGGHTFGDDLDDGERRAVLEYLKTL